MWMHALSPVLATCSGGMNVSADKDVTSVTKCQPKKMWKHALSAPGCTSVKTHTHFMSWVKSVSGIGGTYQGISVMPVQTPKIEFMTSCMSGPVLEICTISAAMREFGKYSPYYGHMIVHYIRCTQIRTIHQSNTAKLVDTHTVAKLRGSSHLYRNHRRSKSSAVSKQQTSSNGLHRQSFSHES